MFVHQYKMALTVDNQNLIADLLRANGLKKTPIRIEILSLFLDHSYALSASDIVSKMTTGHDKVTIYRALSSFEENGILHRASEDQQGIKYAICGDHCPDEQHKDEHAHFICDSCHQTYCLENVHVPEPVLSEGFSAVSASLIINGTCKDCKTTS